MSAPYFVQATHADRALGAVDDLCHDAEHYSDWLANECAGASRVALGYVPGQFAPGTCKDRFADRMETMTVPMLLVLAMESREWAGLAMEIVKGRYIEANDSYINRLMDEAA